jgi:hypothetical protein
MSSLVDPVLSASLEVVATVDLPGPRAAIDNCLRVAVDLNVTPERVPSGARRIGIGGLYELIDALFEALTNLENPSGPWKLAAGGRVLRTGRRCERPVVAGRVG